MVKQIKKGIYFNVLARLRSSENENVLEIYFPKFSELLSLASALKDTMFFFIYFVIFTQKKANKNPKMVSQASYICKLTVLKKL